MATGDTDVKICSDAMRLLGVDEISSFDDGTVRGGIAENLYPLVRDQVLGMYPWSFSTKKIQLEKSATAPINEYDHAYPMPSDSLTGVPRALYNSTSSGSQAQTTGWDVLGGEVITNYDTVVIDYQARPLEAEMPTYFVQLLKCASAMYFAEPMTDQITKSNHWERIAFGNPSEGGRGGLFRQAAATDGLGQPTSFIADYPLIDTRMSLSGGTLTLG